MESRSPGQEKEEFACTVKGKEEEEGGQAKAERQKYLARAVGSSGKRAVVEEGGSGAAELSCQLCEKLRFMRVARGVEGRGMLASYCQKLQNSH